MKKSELRQLIKETVKSVLKEENYISRQIVEPSGAKAIVKKIGKDNYDKMATYVEKLDKSSRMGNWEGGEEYFEIDNYGDFFEYITSYAKYSRNNKFIDFLRTVGSDFKRAL